MPPSSAKDILMVEKWKSNTKNLFTSRDGNLAVSTFLTKATDVAMTAMAVSLSGRGFTEGGFAGKLPEEALWLVYPAELFLFEEISRYHMDLSRGRQRWNLFGILGKKLSGKYNLTYATENGLKATRAIMCGVVTWNSITVFAPYFS